MQTYSVQVWPCAAASVSVHQPHTLALCILWVCELVVHRGCVGVLSASPVNRARRDADYRGISSAVQPRRQRTQKLFLYLSRFPLLLSSFSLVLLSKCTLQLKITLHTHWENVTYYYTHLIPNLHHCLRICFCTIMYRFIQNICTV